MAVPPEPTNADFLDGLGSFVDRVVVPLEDEHRDRLEDPAWSFGSDGGYSAALRELMRTIRTTSADAGYYAVLAPTSIGGGGLGPVATVEAWEYIHHRYGPARLLPHATIAHWASGPSFLCEHFSPAVREQFLEPIVSGATTMCFAMSEPDAGSDAWGMRTRAVADGEEWMINGTKQWITNAPNAGVAMVFAVTDPALQRDHRGGVSCFLVPTDTPGFAVDSVIKLFGYSGGNEAIVSLRDVRVPAENLVGELDRGFDLAIRGVLAGRIYNAGRCIGLARWALEQATEYAKHRKTFGRAIAEYQGVSFMLAESAIDIYAARTMAMDCARRLEAGERPDRDLSILKAFSTEMCSRVFERCMQVLGGMGLTNESRMYDGWHQARIVRVADGSAEIMRRNIARALLKGDLGF